MVLEKILLFGKWDTTGIEVMDPGLRQYINLEPVYIPIRARGKYAKKRFGKRKVHIVERLINKLMVPGHEGKKHRFTSGRCTGKTVNVMNIVRKAFEIIEKRTGKNPVEVLVRAIENAAPREEIVLIEIGGVRVPKAVDTSPQRRVDVALRWIAQGTYKKCYKQHLKAPEALAEEIIAAAENNPQRSYAIQKKIEIERQAAASR